MSSNSPRCHEPPPPPADVGLPSSVCPMKADSQLSSWRIQQAAAWRPSASSERHRIVMRLQAVRCVARHSRRPNADNSCCSSICARSQALLGHITGVPVLPTRLPATSYGDVAAWVNCVCHCATTFQTAKCAGAVGRHPILPTKAWPFALGVATTVLLCRSPPPSSCEAANSARSRVCPSGCQLYSAGAGWLAPNACPPDCFK